MSPTGALAAVNFFEADVEGGLGPFLATWLAGAAKWQPEQVGLVMTVTGLVGLVFNAPAGALVDRVGRPRMLMAVATALVVAGTLALIPARHLGAVLSSQFGVAAGAALVPPALIALTLGLVGKDRFPVQQGRNQAWNHAGNVVASVAIAWLAGREAGLATFFVFAGMAAASGLSLLLIRRDDFDQERARGTPLGTTEASIWSLLRDRRLLLLCLALTLFHLGNAAMLPLLGQRIAKFGHGNATRWLAICVIVAQFTMVIVAAVASWAASRIRRSWLFVIPCCVLPVRGLMAAFGWSVEWLIPIQILDACGAGLLGVSVPILVADYSWGSGHTQAALGAANTFQGIGAALSNIVGGVLVQEMGWSWAFLGLTAPSLVALTIAFWLHRVDGATSAPAAVALARH